MKGYIFDIKHFAVHDGPGIRTTVFFKGCSLRCVWCHNPESISWKQQIGYMEHKCRNCGSCTMVCPNGAQSIDSNRNHSFAREKCISCGQCIEVCSQRGLVLYGREVSVKEVLEDLLEDQDFYESSGGGVTLSGGECLLQADFCAELLKQLHEYGIHTAVDTCGAVAESELQKVIPYTDLFLYDVKALDENVHKRCTGHFNRQILKNLMILSQSGKEIEIRVPCVPEWNIDQVPKIGRFLLKLEHISGVRLLPYHNYAGTKYKSLGIENTLPANLPSEEDLHTAKMQLEALGLKVLH